MRVRTVVNFLACLLFIYILCVYGPRVFEIFHDELILSYLNNPIFFYTYLYLPVVPMSYFESVIEMKPFRLFFL